MDICHKGQDIYGVKGLRMSKDFKKIINYLVISAIFTEAISFKFLMLSEFKIYNFFLLVTVFVLFLLLRRVYFNKTLIALYIIVISFAIYSVLLGSSSVILALKQLIGICLHSLAFYLLVRFNQGDTKRLYQTYLNIAFFVAIIGLIQVTGFFFKIDPLYDFRSFLHPWQPTAFITTPMRVLRLNSIMPEPSSFCMVMVPAFFASCAAFFKKGFNLIAKIKGLVIIISFLLTFSVVGYIAIFFTPLLLLYRQLKRIYFILACLIACFITLGIFTSIPSYRSRVGGTIYAFTGKIDLKTTNQTTYTFLRNAAVAFDSFKQSFFLGKGLGSHRISYDRYIEQHRITHPVGIYVLNRDDANSLFLRLLSETGLLGLGIFLFFVFRYYVYEPCDNEAYLFLINNSIFILFLIRLIRQGHYFSEGFFFFFWLYYFTKEKVRMKRPAVSTQTR